MAWPVFRTRQKLVRVGISPDLAPKFDQAGQVSCVTRDLQSGDVPMRGWMNAEALPVIIETSTVKDFHHPRPALCCDGAASTLCKKW